MKTEKCNQLVLGECVETETKITIDLSLDNNIIVVGKPGSGKTKNLKNIVFNHLREYPLQNRIAGVFDGKGTRDFDEEAEIFNFKVVNPKGGRIEALYYLTTIIKLMKKREKILKKNNYKTVDDYNREHPQNTIPRYFLIIDEPFLFPENSTSVLKELTRLLNIIFTKSRALNFTNIILVQRYRPSDFSNQVRLSLATRLIHRIEPKDMTYWGVKEKEMKQEEFLVISDSIPGVLTKAPKFSGIYNHNNKGSKK